MLSECQCGARATWFGMCEPCSDERPIGHGEKNGCEMWLADEQRTITAPVRTHGPHGFVDPYGWSYSRPEWRQ